jgi:hypothetical protein
LFFLRGLRRNVLVFGDRSLRVEWIPKITIRDVAEVINGGVPRWLNSKEVIHAAVTRSTAERRMVQLFSCCRRYELAGPFFRLEAFGDDWLVMRSEGGGKPIVEAYESFEALKRDVFDMARQAEGAE